MFTSHSFDKVVQPWMLKFKNKQLENHYQNFLHEDYLQRFRYLYVIVFIDLFIMVSGAVLGSTFAAAGRKKDGWGLMGGSLLLLIGLLFELLVNFWPKLQKCRTLPLGLSILIVCSIFNSLFEPLPAVRPG